MAWWMWVAVIGMALFFAGLFIVACINAASEDFKNKKNRRETKGDIP